CFFFFSSRRRHTRFSRDWSSDVCSSDLTAALGEDKLHLAGKLLRELQQKFGSNGYIHHGQGKWYPGEPLPRWALGIFWRSDGKRSEERRVGKECRARWSQEHERKTEEER